jgi:hypothetical protein
MKGNQDFDPYTYGQVRLDTSQGPDASVGREPEDILFQSAQDAMPQASAFGMAGPSAELERMPNSFQFDSEILGETATAPAMTRPDVGPAAHAQPMLPPPSALTQRSPAGRPPAESHDPARPAPRPREVPVATMRPRPAAPRLGRLGLFMPTLLLACGLGAGAWMYLVWQNVVLAALTAAIGAVGAAFTWIWVRS